MIIQIASVLVAFIFTVLAFIHFNWVIGGTWGYDASLPSAENGKRLFNPSKIATGIVGLGLLIFGVTYVAKSGFINLNQYEHILKYSRWIIITIFLLRAVGDFKYVGFFKKIKNTPFGKADTNIFSPLCLGIGVIGLLIELM